MPGVGGRFARVVGFRLPSLYAKTILWVLQIVAALSIFSLQTSARAINAAIYFYCSIYFIAHETTTYTTGVDLNKQV